MAYRNTPYHVNLIGGFSGMFTPGGQVFYVADSSYTPTDGKSAADSNDGLSPQTPFLTIQKGLDACVDGRGDVVALLPGSWTTTAALTMTKADVTLCAAHGSMPYRKGSVTIVNATASVKMITIDAANCTVDGLTLDHGATAAMALIDIGASTAGTGAVVRNCVLDMESSGTTTDGIAITSGAMCVIENNLISDCDQDGITCADTIVGGIIRNNIINDTVASGSVRYGISASGDNMVVVGNIISASTSAGACIYNNGVQNLFIANRLWAMGANTLCVLHAASATAACLGNHIGCNTDVWNFEDFTTDNTSPSVTADIGNLTTAADPVVCVFVESGVDGANA